MPYDFHPAIPRTALLILTAALSACGGSDYTPSIEKTAALSALQEVAEVGSLGKGSGVLAYEPDTRRIFGSITLSGVTANAAHIHEGVAGVNGPVIVTLVQDPANANVWNVPANATLSASQFEAFKAGGLYYNAHSVKFPGGEVRGQIGREVAIARLSGKQELPQNTSAATGLGVIAVDPLTKLADITLTYTGVTPTAAHIHTAPITANGPVTVPFGTPANNKYTLAGVQMTDAQLADMRNKAMYFNIHSTALPGGEIRGQVGYHIRVASLGGAQEVPPVAGDASGVGFAAYNADTKTVFGRMTVQGFTPNNGHIHRAAAGSNGPVIVPFQQEGTPGLTWTSNGFVAMTDADALLLFADGLYLNAHSAAFPAGHVRGQLTGNK